MFLDSERLFAASEKLTYVIAHCSHFAKTMTENLKFIFVVVGAKSSLVR